MQSSRFFAQKTTKSILALGDYFRRVNYLKKKKITISRKGLLLPEYKSLDMRQHCNTFSKL